jgi:hypothetical protein
VNKFVELLKTVNDHQSNEDQRYNYTRNGGDTGLLIEVEFNRFRETVTVVDVTLDIETLPKRGFALHLVLFAHRKIN